MFSILFGGLKEDIRDFIRMLKDPEFRKILKRMLKDWKWSQI